MTFLSVVFVHFANQKAQKVPIQNKVSLEYIQITSMHQLQEFLLNTP